MTTEIKRAEEKDWQAIKALNQKLFYKEYEEFDKTLDCSWPDKNENYFKDAIKKKSSIALIVLQDGKVAGYLIGSIRKAKSSRNIEKIAELENMFLIPELRSKGLGTELCSRFLEWAKSKGAKRARVTASWMNEKGRRFYEKAGFSNFDIVLEKEL